MKEFIIFVLFLFGSILASAQNTIEKDSAVILNKKKSKDSVLISVPHNSNQVVNKSRNIENTGSEEIIIKNVPRRLDDALIYKSAISDTSKFLMNKKQRIISPNK